MKHAVPHMSAQGYGKIINIGSGTAYRGIPSMLHYVTSKGGIMAMTRALSRELGEHGIRVNTLAPGFTMSETVMAENPGPCRDGTRARGGCARPQTRRTSAGLCLARWFSWPVQTATLSPGRPSRSTAATLILNAAIASISGAEEVGCKLTPMCWLPDLARFDYIAGENRIPREECHGGRRHQKIR